MSSTITHAFLDSFIAITLVNVQPDETGFILAGVISASIVDLDHVIILVKDRKSYQDIGVHGNLHLARSIFHELFGLLAIGIVASLVYYWNPRLASVIFIAFSLHLVQDWLMSISKPFAPLNNTEIRFFPLSIKQKMVIDLAMLTFSGALWTIYLTD